MGNHRAARRARRSPLATRRTTGRVESVIAPTPNSVHFGDSDDTAVLPLVKAQGGKRRAVKHAGPRGPLFSFLPSAPIAVGVTTMAFAVGGVLVGEQTDFEPVENRPLAAASALSGFSGNGVVGERRTPVSRNADRNAAQSDELTAAAEAQALERDAALGELAERAEAQAEKIAENQWVYPLNSVSLTARFGQYGLWASYHTGLDFNGNSGDPIMSIANGVVTEVGYDGAYGNKTVVTLEDGTEVWYAHQSTSAVSVGDTVAAGDYIGTVGATGNVTGSHLHLEIRPGGGDPVDPYAAMQNNGLF